MAQGRAPVRRTEENSVLLAAGLGKVCLTTQSAIKKEALASF